MRGFYGVDSPVLTLSDCPAVVTRNLGWNTQNYTQDNNQSHWAALVWKKKTRGPIHDHPCHAPCHPVAKIQRAVPRV